MDLVRGTGRQATLDDLEVGEGIDTAVLARARQGVEGSRRPAAAVAPEEGPLPPPERLGAEHPTGEVVVDAQVPVLARNLSSTTRSRGMRTGAIPTFLTYS
jgi:hypothetical protein